MEENPISQTVYQIVMIQEKDGRWYNEKAMLDVYSSPEMAIEFYVIPNALWQQIDGEWTALFKGNKYVIVNTNLDKRYIKADAVVYDSAKGWMKND